MGRAYSMEPGIVSCQTCRRDVDPDFETVTKLDGFDQCEECREMCPGCMEYITDDSIKVSGYIVNWRDYVLDGKLVTMHADCAVTTFLQYLDRNFDEDYTTREAIAAMVMRHAAVAA